MKKNISSIDKVVRIVLAAVLVALFLTNVISSVIGIIALIVAAVLVVTGILEFCPLYFLLKLSTIAKEKQKIK